MMRLAVTILIFSRFFRGGGIRIVFGEVLFVTMTVLNHIKNP